MVCLKSLQTLHHALLPCNLLRQHRAHPSACMAMHACAPARWAYTAWGQGVRHSWLWGLRLWLTRPIFGTPAQPLGSSWAWGGMDWCVGAWGAGRGLGGGEMGGAERVVGVKGLRRQVLTSALIQRGCCATLHPQLLVAPLLEEGRCCGKAWGPSWGPFCTLIFQ